MRKAIKTRKNTAKPRKPTLVTENIAFLLAKLTFPRKRSKPVHKIDGNCKTAATVCENLCALNAKSDKNMQKQS
jgi:hypothetical protein